MTIDSISEDVALIARIVAQDEGALSQLYDRYARMIYGIAYRSLQSVEESEEVVLDVFSQIWRIAYQYDVRKARVDTWLFMITRSRILDRQRSLQRAFKVEMAAVRDEIQTCKVSVDPLEEALISEQRMQVVQALQQLSAEQREVLEFAYYRGFTYVEIARQMGLPIGTVKTRIRLGLNKLRICLKFCNTP